MAERVPLRWTSLWPAPSDHCGRCGQATTICAIGFGTSPEGEAHMVSLCYACTIYVRARMRVASETPSSDPPN